MSSTLFSRIYWHLFFLGSVNVYAYPTEDGHDLSSKTPLFSVSGQQTGQHVWLLAYVDIFNQTSNFTVAVELTTIGSARGDIAIDDVELRFTECPGELNLYLGIFDYLDFWPIELLSTPFLIHSVYAHKFLFRSEGLIN